MPKYIMVSLEKNPITVDFFKPGYQNTSLISRKKKQWNCQNNTQNFSFFFFLIKLNRRKYRTKSRTRTFGTIMLLASSETNYSTTRSKTRSLSFKYKKWNIDRVLSVTESIEKKKSSKTGVDHFGLCLADDVICVAFEHRFEI